MQRARPRAEALDDPHRLQTEKPFVHKPQILRDMRSEVHQGKDVLLEIYTRRDLDQLEA